MNKFFYDLSSNELLELKNEIIHQMNIRILLILVSPVLGGILALQWSPFNISLGFLTAVGISALGIIRFKDKIKKIKQQYQITSDRNLRDLIDDILVAQRAERAKNYEKAISIWERMGVLNKAAELRTLMSDLGTVKVSQNVVHGDQVTKTEITDSVLNRSSIGSDKD